jgi:hypothetical protein
LQDEQGPDPARPCDRPFTYSVTDMLNVLDHFAALKTIARPLPDNARNKLLKKAGG